MELPTQFQCPESLLLLLIALYLSHPAQGQAPLACLCSLYTTRGRGNAWTDFPALVIFGYKESPVLSSESPKDAKPPQWECK